MDSTALSPEKVELATISRMPSGKVQRLINAPRLVMLQQAEIVQSRSPPRYLHQLQHERSHVGGMLQFQNTSQGEGAHMLTDAQMRRSMLNGIRFAS